MNPKKDGQMHLGLPIFKSVRDAAASTGDTHTGAALRIIWHWDPMLWNWIVFAADPD